MPNFLNELNDIRRRAGLPIKEAKKPSSIRDITPKVIADIKRITKEVHDEEGCDVNDPDQVAHCWIVAEILTNKYGWTYAGGVYLSKTGEPIATHRWNTLGDGTIVDATPLQFYEGHHLRIIPTSDPEYKRYRLEWDQDYNPDLAHHYPELKGVKWSGEYDVDAINRLDRERGKKWWVKNA